MTLKEPLVRERIRTVKGRTFRDFQVYCGTVNGRKVSFFAQTAEAAAAKGKAFVARCKSADGAILSALSRRHSLDALNALEILAVAGVNPQETTLSTLAAEHVARSGMSLKTLTQNGVDWRTVSFGDLVERYLASIDPIRVRHYKTHKSNLTRLQKIVPPETPAMSLTEADFVKFLAPYKEPVTRNSQLARLKSFANWCVKKRLLLSSPLAGIEPSAMVYKEPAFFEPSKTEQIMRIAEREALEAAASGDDEAKNRAIAVGMFLTLGFFGGIRTSEICRAMWADLNQEDGFIRIPHPKGATCGVRPRIVEFEPNTASWINFFTGFLPHVKQHARSGRDLIVPEEWRVSEWKRDRLAPLSLSWGNDVNHNIMRHTYATMHVTAFRNPGATALNLGHGRSLEKLERHYKGLYTYSSAVAYWMMFPHSATEDARRAPPKTKPASRFY